VPHCLGIAGHSRIEQFRRLTRKIFTAATSADPTPLTDSRSSNVADDLKDRGARDRSRMNVHEEYEVRYWTEKWGVTREQLVAAVQKAGVSAQAVASELGKSHP
jgi:hypothetical protein